MEYSDLNFKKPIESPSYKESSEFAINAIEKIMATAVDSGENKIIT